MRNSRRHFIVAAVAVAATLGATATNFSIASLAAPPTPSRTVRQIARGVELIQEIVPDGSAEGPLVVNVIRIDPKAKGVRLEAALGQDRVWGTDPTMGREIVSSLATRRKAVAGINAGFFPFAGNPIGIHVQDGEWVTEPSLKRSAFYLTEKGQAGVASFDFKGTVGLEGKKEGPTAVLNGMNRRPGKGNEMLLFTPSFFDKTLRAPGRFEVVLSGIKGPLRAGREYTGTVTMINDGGGMPIAPDTIIVSGGGAGAEFLKAHGGTGEKLTLRLDAPLLSGETVDVEKLKLAAQGGPRLLTDGKVDIPLAAEGIGRSFSTDRHPRTAVGITRNGTLLLLTVDGRQKGLSRGASLPETAELLLKYGAVEGVNMDGGGSTALVVRDAIVNSPSDGKERPVANALLVFADDASPAKPEVKDDAKPLSLTAPPRPLAVGETWKFPSVPGISGGVWGTKGGTGFVSQEGVFRALRPGAAEVRLFVGGKVGTLTTTFTIAAPTTPVAPTPVEKPASTTD
jgi:hypothetical protein